MIGANALSAYNDHTIDTGSRMVAVAMPSDDIEIFSKIVKKEYKKDRFVEKSTNDMADPSFFVAYGDTNTAFFVLSNLDTHKSNGIIVRIYPIRKPVTKVEDVEETIGIQESIRNSINRYIRKHEINSDVFYVRYGLDVLRFARNLFANFKNYLARNYSKPLLKERLYNIFGRDSWFTESILTVYRYAYASFDFTYFYFKNLRKKPFINTWNDLKYHDNAKILNRELNTELFDDIDRIEVDGIDLNLPGSEFFIEFFGKNYKKRKVKSKPLRPTVVLDTGNSYQKIIKERRKYIDEIKSIQREVRKTRYEVLEETTAVNKIFKIVKMTDAQIRYQRYFERNRQHLFSLDIEDEEDFRELYHRLLPIINNLRRYSEENMTFSIDDEADSLIQNVLLKIGEDGLVYKLKELSEQEYFIE